MVSNIIWILDSIQGPSNVIVNFEPKSNCQYHLSSSVSNWQHTFLFFDKTFWKTRWDDSIKTLDFFLLISTHESNFNCVNTKKHYISYILYSHLCTWCICLPWTLSGEDSQGSNPKVAQCVTKWRIGGTLDGVSQVIIHSQKWWVLCSSAYLRWRRRDVCNFHIIYLDDIIHNCMCVIFWTWKWYIESSWIKWNKN